MQVLLGIGDDVARLFAPITWANHKSISRRCFLKPIHGLQKLIKHCLNGFKVFIGVFDKPFFAIFFRHAEHMIQRIVSLLLDILRGEQKYFCQVINRANTAESIFQMSEFRYFSHGISATNGLKRGFKIMSVMLSYILFSKIQFFMHDNKLFIAFCAAISKKCDYLNVVKFGSIHFERTFLLIQVVLSQRSLTF